ncbi:MAG: GNAT family N-acetyltransferase [Bacteroidetes bacterium]|nr:GNAT family N-acetyltransferase [Bacteroidota bacterium]
MMEIRLFEDYVLREVSAEQLTAVFDRYADEVFHEDIYIPVESWLTEDQQTAQRGLARLLRERYVLRTLIYKGEEVVGWHLGWQKEADTYYMTNTAVLQEYRGRGIYSEMVIAVIEYLRGKGFQKLTSRHHASANTILTAKLRAGFQITGIEVDERFGILVCLSYFYNEKRRDAYRFRIGTKRPDEELKKFL